MIVAGDVVGEGDEFGELHGVAGACLLAEAVPGSHAVELDFSGLDHRFEKNECIANTFQEIGTRNFAELRFGIVEVVDVDAINAEIVEAAADLVFEEARRHAVAAADDIVGREDSGLDVFAIEVVVGIGGHGTVGREVAALGAEDEFFSGVALL
jgi:hypothetical protein